MISLLLRFDGPSEIIRERSRFHLAKHTRAMILNGVKRLSYFRENVEGALLSLRRLDVKRGVAFACLNPFCNVHFQESIYFKALACLKGRSRQPALITSGSGANGLG